MLVAVVTAVVLTAACALVVEALAESARVTDLSLTVTFQPNHTITVTLPDGTPVGSATGTPTLIPAGSYTLHLENPFAVSGPSFDLSGPGVKVVDDMFFGESPSSTYLVTFQVSSSYAWRDDETPSVVFTFNTSATASGGSSGTTSTGSSTTPTGSSTWKPVVGSAITSTTFRGTLVAAVSPAGKLSLTKNGKDVTTLRAGRYKFAVHDKSSNAGFIVQGLRKQAVTLTNASFTGNHTVTVTLGAGQWLYYAASNAKHYFVVIA